MNKERDKLKEKELDALLISSSSPSSASTNHTHNHSHNHNHNHSHNHIHDDHNVSPYISILSCALYAFVSISITFFNKAVLSSYSFQSPNMMTLFQMLFSLLLLIIMKRVHLVSYANVTWDTMIKVTHSVAEQSFVTQFFLLFYFIILFIVFVSVLFCWIC